MSVAPQHYKRNDNAATTSQLHSWSTYISTGHIMERSRLSLHEHWTERARYLDSVSIYTYLLGGTTFEVWRKDVFGDTHLVASSRQPARHVRLEQWLCLNCTYYSYYHNVPVVLVQ